MNLEGNEITGPHRLSGFALPTILIASIIMLTVLLAAVTSTSSVRAAMTAQYYNQISRNAGEAGVAYAKSCLDINNGVALWTNAKPLKPNTDCSGNETYSCPEGSRDVQCSVLVNGNAVASFTVGAPQTAISGWKQISAGSQHTCALSFESQVYCWGNNDFGQLGNGDAPNFSLVPTKIVTAGTDLEGKTIKFVAVGTDFTCVIGSDSKLYCWGRGDVGQLGDNISGSSAPICVVDSLSYHCQPTPVAVNVANGTSSLYDKNILSVDVGYQHACALASDSTAHCWGRGGEGQLGNGVNSQRNAPFAVAAGAIPAGEKIKSISTGTLHTCAILTNSTAYCWGNNANGQLGNGNTTPQSTPVAVLAGVIPATEKIKSISAGGYYTCATASDGLAYCWGKNDFGQLGYTLDSLDKNTPVKVTDSGVLSGKTILSIDSGDQTVCAVASNSLAYCWGRDTSRLGDNSAVSSSSNVPVSVVSNGALSGKTLFSINSSGSHTCAIASDSQAYCWGMNHEGQLGNNDRDEVEPHLGVDYPVNVVTANIADGKATDVNSVGTANLLRSSDGGLWRQFTRKSRLSRSEWIWKQIATGSGYHNCAIASDSKAYCWGFNGYGQLGINNGNADTKIPLAVDTSGVLRGKTIRAISTGFNHTCAIASDGLGYCWGLNTYGQLGNSSNATSTVPVAIYVGTSGSPGALYSKTLVAISAGENFTCAIASDSNVYCWGRDNHGQLGDDAAIADKNVPTAVNKTNGVSSLYGKTVTAISAGFMHACVIDSNGTGDCWGEGSNGAVGDGTNTPRPVPVNVAAGAIPAGTKLISVSAGLEFSCAIGSNSLAYCWGYNTDGSLGDNDMGNSKASPVAVYTSGSLSGKSIMDISAGEYNTCVIASDSKVYCFGLDDNGELGDGLYTSSAAAKAVVTSGVLNGKNIISLKVGAHFTYALASDGKAYSWGWNDSGALGNQMVPFSGSNVPVNTFSPSYVEYSF